MRFQHPIFEIILSRRSCRSFDQSPVLPEARAILQAACTELTSGLLAEPARFAWLDLHSQDRKLSGGLIRNASGLLVGGVQASRLAYTSYGYLMEQLVLKATDIGLGTCWVALFARELVSEFGPGPNDVCPAVVAVGNLPDRVSFRDRIIRAAARSDGRKPWSELFFRERDGSALNRSQAGTYAPALDMLQLAPSAGNSQPWRVIKAVSAPVFHFYVRPTPHRYEKHPLHEVDIGIAACHFELGARASGLAGRWQVLEPEYVPPLAHCSYIVTWFGDQSWRIPKQPGDSPEVTQ
ncbi:MAG: nitroreductase family protein [candidate division WOR-3 bacterium]